MTDTQQQPQQKTEAAPKMSNMELTKLLLHKILAKKRWLLLPLWLLLALVAVILTLTGSPYILPILYIAF
ncbi:MAG: hypothetical protein GX410_01875 [Elusimicrobia bacterium]|nr:hypothetical protein [Elusimicrobiota bacterium]